MKQKKSRWKYYKRASLLHGYFKIVAYCQECHFKRYSGYLLLDKYESYDFDCGNYCPKCGCKMKNPVYIPKKRKKTVSIG